MYKGKGRETLSSSKSDLNNLDTSPQPTGPPTAPPLSHGIAIGRSQQGIFFQLPPQHQISTSSAVTETYEARGKARKKLKKLESREAQDSRNAVVKAEWKVQRAEAAARREKKKKEKEVRIAPRKEDISKLANLLRILSPIEGE